jgi:HAD superfamily hydrolase (TIGR01484 family)
VRYLALATDFDATLAHGGCVAGDTIEAVKELKKSGRRVFLVTGRLVDSLRDAFQHLDLFDLVVAENGAVLFDPGTTRSVPLAQRPPEAFMNALRNRGVAPLEAGHVIVATSEPHESTVVETIRELGLELQIIFNKGAVMILPSGVNKATGLQAALERCELSPHNVVAVGDAENDHALLQFCELSAAVANALPSLKNTADLVLAGDHGAGVTELIRALLDSDCASCVPKRLRSILLGHAHGRPLFFEPYVSGAVLIAGSSGSGKSTIASSIVERIMEQRYQVCIIDPEGDYGTFAGVTRLGDADRVPTLGEIESLLAGPSQSIAVDLTGVPVDARADFSARLLPRLTSLRNRTGRPHWIVLDEAHQLLRSERSVNPSIPSAAFNVLAVTTHPGSLSKELRDAVHTMIAAGADPEAAVRAMNPCFTGSICSLPRGTAALWRRSEPGRIIQFDSVPPSHGSG